MTLIECFTSSHVDNIAACLRLRPDKLIMVGDAGEMTGPVGRYRKLLKNRKIATEISLCDVRGMDWSELCGAIGRLVREAGECVIDLTGGEEPVIMAVGAVLAGLDRETRQRIRVEKFFPDAGMLRDCIRDEQSRVKMKSLDLSVSDVIAIHGGSLHPDAYQPPVDCTVRELEGLWDIVSEAPRDWNRSIMLLGEFESRSLSKNPVRLSLSELSGSISNFVQKEPVVRKLLEKLRSKGIIEDRSTSDTLEYTYKSYILRYCTQKAGNVLEVKTLLEGRSVLENGAPFFQDCRMSVSIDWDGVIYDPVERVPETRNEIDVVLMHGTTPLFISCKNGNIGEEELYKLHTVAERFGGPYVKKMLIATDLDRKSPAANRAFIQRAWDMDIFLVTDAAELSREEWRQMFRKAMQ